MSLDQLRRQRLMSHREFAAAAGVARQTLVNLTAGRRVHLSTIRRMAKRLDVDPMAVIEFRRQIEGNPAPAAPREEGR